MTVESCVKVENYWIKFFPGTPCGRGGRYTEEDAKVIVVQILSVIAYCHLQGVVPRDLKPENFIFATREEDASMRVIDFGLSNFIRPDQRLNDIVGSAYYVAPEVLHSSYSVEADMWSIGCPRSQRFCREASEQGSQKKNAAAEALTHPWLRDERQAVPLDLVIYKLVKSYVRATPFRRAAMKWYMLLINKKKEVCDN